VRVLNWLFRNRRTGRITIAQVPNVPLVLWIGLTVAERLWDPRGGWATSVEVAAFAALAVWAVDEMVRGVNPWRRLLGAVVLALSIASRLA
jgi:hypothetical protein